MERRGPKPIGERAMSIAERQRQYLARIREQAAAAAPKPRGLPVTVEDFKFAPRPTGRWLGMRISNRAIREVIAGLTQALADHADGD